MNNLVNLVGQRFGKLTVLERSASNSKSGNAKWLCKCDCGNTAIVIGSKLRNCHTTSCGWGWSIDRILNTPEARSK